MATCPQHHILKYKSSTPSYQSYTGDGRERWCDGDGKRCPREICSNHEYWTCPGCNYDLCNYCYYSLLETNNMAQITKVMPLFDKNSNNKQTKFGVDISPLNQTTESIQNNINDLKENDEKHEIDDLIFQCKLPQPFIKNEELENKIKHFLNEDAKFNKNWGDPILIILRSNWKKETFSQNELSFYSQVQRGSVYSKYFIDVSCVAFNPEQDLNHKQIKEICNIIHLQIESKRNSKEIDGYNINSVNFEPFDSRQLSSNLYNMLISKYSKEIVNKSHLKTSNITNEDNKLIISCKEIRRLHLKGLTGRKQQESIKNAYESIKNGANPNIIIPEFPLDFDENERIRSTHGNYRAVHYGAYLMKQDREKWVKFMINNGADLTLTAFYSYDVDYKIWAYYIETPWAYFVRIDIMDEELDNIMGGNPFKTLEIDASVNVQPVSPVNVDCCDGCVVL